MIASRAQLGSRGWRRVRRGVISLVLGVVATVGVAWGVLFLPEPQLSASRLIRMGPGEHGWDYALSQEWSSTRASIRFFPGVHPITHPLGARKTDWSDLVTPNIESVSLSLIGGGEDGVLVVSGWPRHCLAGARSATWLPTRHHNDNFTAGTLCVRSDSQSTSRNWFRYHLPATPLWPGFPANTAIYGGAVFVLLSAPALVRSWRRRRRGGCANCGYDVSGITSGVCPECGADIGTTARPLSPPLSQGERE